MRSIISTILLSAVAVSAAPGLSLDVTGPPSVVDVTGLTVKTTLRNTGDVTLKLLNDPRTVLSKANTNTFNIASSSGSPTFTGIKVKYVPAKAVELSKESAFTVLVPGQIIEITHNLAGVYNFTQAGEGTYTASLLWYIQSFDAVNVFNYVDASGALKTIQAASNPHEFKISGKLAVYNGYTSNLSKRIVSYTGCTVDQQGQIKPAADASDVYVVQAQNYLASNPSDTPRYTTWFGQYSTRRHEQVRSVYDRIGTSATSTDYDCTACKNNTGVDYDSTFAYVYPGSPGKIYLCGAFWKAPMMGADSRAGTIVHENSHFDKNGGTRDYAYGEGDAQSLAKNDPDTAIQNADNYEYFAENYPVRLSILRD